MQIANRRKTDTLRRDSRIDNSVKNMNKLEANKRSTLSRMSIGIARNSEIDDRRGSYYVDDMSRIQAKAQ